MFDVIDRTRGVGDRRWWPGLWSVTRDGSTLRQLVKLDRAFVTAGGRIAREPLEYNHVLLQVPRDGGDEVIVGQYRFDASGAFVSMEAKRLDVRSGRANSISAGTPQHMWSWLFEPGGEPRVVMTRDKGREAVWWRGPGEESWRRLAEFDALRAPYVPRFVGRDGALFVTTASGRQGEEELRRYDFAAGRPARAAMVATPGFDFRGRVLDGERGQSALGVRLTTDAESTVWFDPRMKALQAEADALLPGRINRLDCRRCDQPDAVTLVFSYSDREPGSFWLHRAAAGGGKGQWREIARRHKAIDPAHMASVAFERIKARDGLDLPVWITTPPGAAARPRAAVVLVHGGPWVRGRAWDWEADAQFLASRGHVVIEPEFRGSKGYGRRHYEAGWRQWGQAMQDDLADAVDWAAGKGLIDRGRVCIAGASYGGYATLMGLAKQGDVFRCGVAWAAVSDPRLMFEWRRDYDVGTEGRDHDYPALIGDPVKDADMLAANTPVLLAARMRAPLLLAYGGSDRRVPIVHGKRMRDALTDAGQPPLWVEYPAEGHGWLTLETRVDFARRMEAFLAQHLGP